MPPFIRWMMTLSQTIGSEIETIHCSNWIGKQSTHVNEKHSPLPMTMNIQKQYCQSQAYSLIDLTLVAALCI